MSFSKKEMIMRKWENILSQEKMIEKQNKASMKLSKSQQQRCCLIIMIIY